MAVFTPPAGTVNEPSEGTPEARLPSQFVMVGCTVTTWATVSVLTMFSVTGDATPVVKTLPGGKLPAGPTAILSLSARTLGPSPAIRRTSSTKGSQKLGM